VRDFGVGRTRCAVAIAFVLAPTVARGSDPIARVQEVAWPARLDGELLSRVRAAAGDRLAAEVSLRAEVVPLRGDARLEVVRVLGDVDGVPLSRPVAAVLRDRSGATALLTSWFGDVPPPIAAAPRIDGASARERVRASGRPGSAGARTPELVIVPGAGASRAMWRVETDFDPHARTRPVFLVDALTGAVAVAADRALSASVRTFEHNPVATPVAEVLPLGMIDMGATNLVGPRFVAKNCVEPMPGVPCEPVHLAVADMNGDFLYPAPDIAIPADNAQLEDEFAEVAVYYHADRFDAWLGGLGFPGILCSESETGATLVANLRNPGPDGWFANAFYTGDCGYTLAFGQAQTVDFGYDGDVVYHELGHGVVERQIGAGNFLGGDRRRADAVVTDAGALNEGIADFLSIAYGGNSVMGEYIGLAGYARDAVNDFACASGLEGEIHGDSQPWTAALWAAQVELGEPFVVAVIDAIPMLAPDATFEEASAVLGTLVEAELGAAAAATVETELASRGLVDCPRIAAWDQRERGLWLYPADWIASYNPMRPPPFQISFAVPDDATSMRITYVVSDLFEWGPDYDVNLLTRQGSPITFTYEQPGGGVVYVEADSEMHWPDLDPAGLDIPVRGGEVFYGAFFNLGDDLVLIEDIRAEFELEPGGTGTTGEGSSSDGGGGGESGPAGSTTFVPTDDSGSESTGEDAVDDGGRGCGCRGASGGPGAAALLVLPLLRCRRRSWRWQ
jgi:hypothetical protein